MSTVKEEAIKLIESLPETCTVDDIHYHLYVREKVLRGSQCIDEARVFSQEEAEQRIMRRFTSA